MTSEDISPIDIKGTEILKRVFLRDAHEGAPSIEITGPQGSGKTSMLFHLVSKIMYKNPEELVFMKDSHGNIQCNRFENWRILTQKGVSLEIRDMYTNRILKMPITVFETFEDLYFAAKPLSINVIYFKDDIHDWMDFMGFIRRTMHRTEHPYLDQTKKGLVWKTIIWDEYDDICPADQPNPMWKWIENLKNELKHTRKGLVTLLADTHNVADCDYRVRGKMMMRCFLKGTRRDKYSRVSQKAIDALKEVIENEIIFRQALIEWDASFGKIRFRAFPPKTRIDIKKLN